MHTRALLLAVLLVMGVLAAPAHAGIVGEPVAVASDLATPWDVLLLPDGRTLVTERPGRVKVIEGQGTGQTLLSGIPGLQVNKFLGLVAHPGYARNRLLYLYVNDRRGDGALRNRIVRLLDEGDRLTPQATILDGIDSDGNHDGGRMAFGPDQALYVTTGDVHRPERPQDRQSLNGKILRLEVPGGDGDGAPAADNPFAGEGANARFVWSFGHRHPQGLAFDAAGRLYESEHGPSGETYGATYPGGNGRSSRDEVNLIEKGANYGWPLISGDETGPGMRAPIATSGTGPAWAPGGLAVGPENRLYVTMLAGQHLRELTVQGASVTSQVERYAGTYGRLRAAAVGCRGLYFTQDGTTASVLRVALEPAPPCTGSPAPAAPAGPAAPGGAASPTAGVPGQGRAPVTAALARLLRRAVADLRARRLGRLSRSRRLTSRASGFPAGRLSLRLAAGQDRTVGAGRVAVRAGRTVGVTVRIGPRGRARLRGRPTIRLVLRATHVAAAGARTTVARSLTLRR